MQRQYSLRKLSIGLASVAIGIGIINGTGQSVKADTAKNTSTNGLVTPSRNFAW